LWATWKDIKELAGCNGLKVKSLRILWDGQKEIYVARISWKGWNDANFENFNAFFVCLCGAGERLWAWASGFEGTKRRAGQADKGA